MAVVYVSCGEERVIERYRLDPASGSLAHLGSTAIPGIAGPSSSTPLAVSRDRRVLYAALREPPYPVVSFAVSDGDGALTEIARAELPDSMCYLSTDPGGRWLFSASYGGAVVAASPVEADGAVRRPASQVAKTLPNAHCVRTDPEGRHVYSPCLGGDAVLIWDFDAASGLAAPDRPRRAALAAKAGPRHLTFTRDGRLAYVVNELDGTVTGFARDKASGALTALRSVPAVAGRASGSAAAADIHLTPDGRFLYASVRSDSHIAVFAAGADGALSPVERVAVETTPRGFAIDPTGRWLICAGRDAAAIGLYAIDAGTGRLTRRERVATGANPNWVEIIFEV